MNKDTWINRASIQTLIRSLITAHLIRNVDIFEIKKTIVIDVSLELEHSRKCSTISGRYSSQKEDGLLILARRHPALYSNKKQSDSRDSSQNTDHDGRSEEHTSELQSRF